ncbi:MAG: S1C family serine protease [Chloroflexota bacterium]
MYPDTKHTSRSFLPVFTLIIFLSLCLCVVFGMAAAIYRLRLPGSTATVRTLPTYTAAAPVVIAPEVQEDASTLEAQVAAVYDLVSGSVVHIRARSVGYDFFLNAIPQEGTGSGFVYDDAGHVVTNYHVIEGAEQVFVLLEDETTIEANVVGSDPSTDLAVLEIPREQFPSRPLALADSDALRVGQFVVAVGNPFGLDRTLTFGVVSSLGRVIESPDGRYIGEAIQTDAAINPGNSGGPLLDLQGRLIGVNSQIFSPSGANAGIGFAIPANTVKQVVPELIQFGYYRHPWMGARFFELDSQRASALKRAGIDVPEQGLLLVEVTPASPAAQAGLRAGEKIMYWGNVRLPVDGDVITAINGVPITSYQDYIVYLEINTRPGDTVEVTFVRQGQSMDVNVTLGEQPQP